MLYHYFVSYSFPSGNGRFACILKKEITCIEDIEKIEEHIKENEKFKVVITNYQLMRTEKEPEAAAKTATA